MRTAIKNVRTAVESGDAEGANSALKLRADQLEQAEDELVRLEAALPLYGHELGLDPEGREIPAFASDLSRFAISFSPLKGDFIGRDAIQKSKDEGLKQVICSVLVEKDACILYGGEAVYHNGKSIARLRSGGYGHTIGKNIGFAYLPPELAKPGTEVEIDSFCEKFPAKVGPLCNYDSKGEKIRA